jgi:membrane protease YdiL (CAAX protease family)
MTFDVPEFLLISAFAVAALTLAVPGQVRSLLSRRSDIKAPVPLVMAGAVIQQSLFAVGLAAVGSAFAPRTGLEAPWFAAVSDREGLGLDQAAAQLPAALAVGAASTVLFLLLYYQVFRPRMATEDTARLEEFRTSMGFFGRILMGGIAEEVMFRWGVMSVMAWLAVGVLGMPPGVGMWTAIVVAGLLFGLGHLPGAMASGVKITKLIVVTALALNMVVALSSGWLFWRHGLLAAIVAHGLLHAVWHPLERSRGRDRPAQGL